MTLYEKIVLMTKHGYELEIMPRRSGDPDRVACLAVWKHNDADIPIRGQSCFLTEEDLRSEALLTDRIDECMDKLTAGGTL
jgi:hypothetical protein